MNTACDAAVALEERDSSQGPAASDTTRNEGMNEATYDYDYIVVGAGSAECVIASRLSERADVRVLLIEAGGSTATEAMKTPSGVLQLDPSVFWDSETPVPPGTGTRIGVRTGHILGGSSSVNGLSRAAAPFELRLMGSTRGHWMDLRRVAAIFSP
jgi:hypothetical protein